MSQFWVALVMDEHARRISVRTSDDLGRVQDKARKLQLDIQALRGGTEDAPVIIFDWTEEPSRCLPRVLEWLRRRGVPAEQAPRFLKGILAKIIEQANA